MEKFFKETVEIVSAHVTNNSIPIGELPGLIKAVHNALIEIADGPKIEAMAGSKLEPAVPIKKSVHRDFLLSLENGRRYQTLRRHLLGLGMTPQEYRAKWGLPADYPMVAAAYSERRSALAKSLGLGRKAAVEVTEPISNPKRSRGKAKVQPLVEGAPEIAEKHQALCQQEPLALESRDEQTAELLVVSAENAQEAA